MVFKALMVHVDHGDGAAERVKLACMLAGRFGAHLIGLGACPIKVPLADPYTTGGMVVEFLKQEQAQAEASVRKAEAIFAAVAAAYSCSTEWRGSLSSPATALARESRAADLLVLGRGTTGADADLPDLGDVVMSTGRPVLVAGPGSAPAALPSSVVVAWKDTRETRRAVLDALPFLQLATKVTVVECCDDDDTEAATERLGDVALFLGRHGVNADPLALPPAAGSTADRLFAIAAREQAGLIVMGAYGHARMREWAFGGVTRRMLADSPVHCLFSH